MKRQRNFSHKRKNEKPKRYSPLSLVQSFYLSAILFSSNDLISSASACTFGFLLSVVPVGMIVCLVLLHILHASPETVSALIRSTPLPEELIDIRKIFPVTLRLITNFEIILLIAIIWMARRFFSSVITGLRRIFQPGKKPRAVRNIFTVLLTEAIFVIFFSLITFVMLSSKTIVFMAQGTSLSPPTFFGSLEPLNHISMIVSKVASESQPFLFLFAVILLTYKFGSRIKPSWTLTLIAAIASTVSCWLLEKVFYLFININRYNMVYGLLSGIIVTLMIVYFFFIIFFFFAQWIYVFQFFETVLFGELYMLPEKGDRLLSSRLKRLLLINSDFLFSERIKAEIFNEGEKIYTKGEKSDGAFYIASGSVLVKDENKDLLLEGGNFFGEEEAILDDPRSEEAISVGKSKIIRVPRSELQDIIARNPIIGGIILEKISRQKEQSIQNS